MCELSDKIMDRLEQTELFQAASCIALYHAIPGEVQTAGFIEKWYQKKKLLLPLIVGDDLRLLLYEGPESLKPGPFGILEPKVDGIEVPKNEIDLIIVPGVAFDKDMHRTGSQYPAVAPESGFKPLYAFCRAGFSSRDIGKLSTFHF